MSLVRQVLACRIPCVLCTVCFLLFAFTGCASLGSSLNAGPEFSQTIQLIVDDNYQLFQAQQSDYDVGDLQAFHAQHTFPILVEGAFEEIFSGVRVVKETAGIEAGAPDVPAIFEVRMVDLAHDINMEADNYRAQTMIAAAMKDSSGKVLWQEAFRGRGYVLVDPQYSTGLGPQDAVVDAVYDALGQMQKAIVNSPAVKNQLRYYLDAKMSAQRPDVNISVKEPSKDSVI